MKKFCPDPSAIVPSKFKSKASSNPLLFASWPAKSEFRYVPDDLVLAGNDLD